MSGKSETTEAKQGGRWHPGQSGNPAGRPKGARHAALVALDKIGAANAEALMQRAIEMALTGDVQAMRIMLDRLWPARRGRPVEVDIPALHTPADAVAALGAIAAAASMGEVTPEEAHALASIVEAQRRAIETLDLARRIEALEAKAAQ